MKRRVASLPPISLLAFEQRVAQKTAETAVTAPARSLTCDLCSKVFSAENTYKSHLQSKKHKERVAKGVQPPKVDKPTEDKTEDKIAEEPQETKDGDVKMDQTTEQNVKETPESGDEDIDQAIEAKIAAARNRLSPLDCLFCPEKSPSLDSNLTHMSSAHSFFIPDAEYLTDIQGLIAYLGEKIAVGNVCIFCNEKSKEFRSLEAVRKHMVDKVHCKIAYGTSDDRLEVSDFYDFTKSYPDAPTRKRSKRKPQPQPDAEAEEWEDVSDDEDNSSADEVVDESASESDTDLDELDETENQLTYGDSEFELVLPSGARIGHRSLRRYYAQSFHTVLKGKDDADPNSGAALVRKLITDKNSALVPTKGGFGAFGAGTEVVKARNAGEAREAGRHVREFRDQRRREEFKTKVAYRHNSQKHFRDPLLQ